MVGADKIIGSIPLDYSNLVVDASPCEFGLTVGGFVALWMRKRLTGWWLDPHGSVFKQQRRFLGSDLFNLLWNSRCRSPNGIMGDAVQQSCPTLMDIYCFFWIVGPGHTHKLILMSPPASCCSLSFPVTSYFWVYLPYFSSCQCREVVEGKSDADTQRQSGDSEAASRLLRHGGSSNATSVNHDCILSPFNRRAQSQYVTSKTRIIFLEQQRLKDSWNLLSAHRFLHLDSLISWI